MQSQTLERGSAKAVVALLVAGALALAAAGFLYYRHPALFGKKAGTANSSAAKPGTLTEIPSGAPSGTAGGSSLPQAPSRSVTGNNAGVAGTKPSPPVPAPARSEPAGNNSKASIPPAPLVPQTAKILPPATVPTGSRQPPRPRLEPDPSIPMEEPPISTRPAAGSSSSAVPSLPASEVPSAPAGPAPVPTPYTGQRSGTLSWSGTLEKDGVVVIDGNRASAGSVTGELPGVPVEIDLNAKEFGVAEAPSPSNGWKRIAIRSRRKRTAVVTIKWTALP
jgi:hypothetical protein